MSVGVGGPARLRRLCERFAPLLLEWPIQGEGNGSLLLQELAAGADEAFNGRAQVGAWAAAAAGHQLTAAPLPVLAQLLAHPFFQQADEAAARALLFGHAALAPSPALLMTALCQIYTVNGGGAKRSASFRAGWSFLFAAFFFYFSVLRKRDGLAEAAAGGSGLARVAVDGGMSASVCVGALRAVRPVLRSHGPGRGRAG